MTAQQRVERLTAVPTAGSADATAIERLEAGSQVRPLGLAALLAEVGGPTGGQDEGQDGVVLVVRDAGAVVGMASARAFVDEVHVLRLVVDPAHRRRGLGRALLDGLVDWAEERGAGAVALEVREGSAPARGLYATAGFVLDGRRPGYYPDGEDALLLRRPLVGAGRRG